MFPVYLGIDSDAGPSCCSPSASSSCAAITLAPLGRRKRLTVAAEAEPVDVPEAVVFDELEPAPVPGQDPRLESGDPELEHDDRRTS